MDDRAALLLQIQKSLSTVPLVECKILADWYEESGFPWHARLWRDDVEVWIQALIGNPIESSRTRSGHHKVSVFCGQNKTPCEKREGLPISLSDSIDVYGNAVCCSNRKVLIGSPGICCEYDDLGVVGAVSWCRIRCFAERGDANALLNLAANYMIGQVLNDSEALSKEQKEPFKNCIDNLRELQKLLVAYLVNHPENRWNRGARRNPGDHIDNFRDGRLTGRLLLEGKSKIQWFTD